VESARSKVTGKSQRAGAGAVGAVRWCISGSLLSAETEHDAERSPGGIRGAIREAQAYVIKLRAQGEVARELQVHASSGAPGEAMTAATSRGQTVPADDRLNECRNGFPAIGRKTRAAQECVGICGNAGWRQVINREVRGEAQPIVEIADGGNAAAMSIRS